VLIFICNGCNGYGIMVVGSVDGFFAVFCVPIADYILVSASVAETVRQRHVMRN